MSDEYEIGKPSPDSLKGMEHHAEVRIKKWCEDWSKKHGPDLYIQDDTTNGDPPHRMTLLLSATHKGGGKRLSDDQLLVIVVLDYPLEPEVKLFDTDDEWEVSDIVEYYSAFANVIQPLFDELMEVASPHPRSDGSWWADKETFELARPVYEGERLSPTPDDRWIAIDPKTYEPVTGGEVT